MRKHTLRQEQIISCLLQGMSNREIAQELGLAERTIKAAFNRLFIMHEIHDPDKISRVVLAVKMYRERNEPQGSTR